MSAEPAVTITAYPDGPLIVRGDFVLSDLGGEVADTGRVVALCRCGRSALKPLCDGTHKSPLSARRRAGASEDDAHSEQ